MRNYAGSALMLIVTTAAAIGSYTINLQVSGERAVVDALRRQIVSDARDMRNLQAELRTRARFPEMQRWNDNVLQMSAPSEQQYLRSAVQLAGFGVPPEAPDSVDAAVRFAVTAPVPPEPAGDAVILTASVREQPARIAAVRAPAAREPAIRIPAPAALVRASYPAPSRRTPSLATMVADIDASLDSSLDSGAGAAPHDLLPDGGQ